MAVQTWNISRLYFPVFAWAIYDLAPEISEDGSSILLDIRGIHEGDDTGEGMDVESCQLTYLISQLCEGYKRKVRERKTFIFTDKKRW